MSDFTDGSAVRVRLVSYNVRGLRDDAGAVAQILRELDPDVVCLQEMPRWLAWRGRCAALARRAHLLYAGGGGNTGGTGLMTAVRVDVHDLREHRLRRTPGLHRRGTVLATLGKGPARFGVASVHLGLDAAERARHFTDISGLIKQMTRSVEGAGTRGGERSGQAASRAEDPVVIIAGDMNETPSAMTWTRIAGQYVDAGADDPTPTFSTAQPRHRIDGVFTRGPVEVASYSVLDSPLVAAASDHRPVVADLLLPSSSRPAAFG
ncbi:endonuclease/exonuclease/phosphatase family protein [Phytoactinopolyspora mesophila]|uniref:Endonuclease n=1 Tax=Phytoactinopolyspora mesophila TaxID=2650750 RepID=A0A7K3M308_9ACTN|nr:endonuclease/exonuclease/phosphatase family protein [Phytoactinopolyspora mesophila]NDL57302.1 endonuclease [Phytoactinopolyspora mesophila]